MRRPSFTSNRGGEFDLLMTPMIDVVFLLLVFFIWTASIATVEYLLPSSLQATPGGEVTTSDPPPPPDIEPVVVRIVWLGNRAGWIISGNAIGQFAEVKQTLAAVAEIKRDVPVIIDPEPDVPLGDVIDLYDTARLVGFQEIQFAASESI